MGRKQKSEAVEATETVDEGASAAKRARKAERAAEKARREREKALEKVARKAKKDAEQAAKRGKKVSGRPAKVTVTAKTADKHDLYQRSVQNTDEEVKFVAETFRELRGRPAITLREDFCGTAAFSASWVRLTPPARTATGLDIDREVLEWGRQHNIAALGELAPRVTLLERDVREPSSAAVDVVTAFNFSYWLFKTRRDLRGYFSAVYASLAADGAFFLDAYGGWEAHEPMLEKRDVEGQFTYVWDQDEVNPIDNGIKNHIHFRFKDGSKLERAFTYDWRLWSLAEIRELLEEAGFASVTVYWDVAGDGDDEDYRPRTRAENQPGWLAYIVACK